MSTANPTLSGVLTGLIRDRGPGLLGERRRLLGLLRDRMPGEVRAIRILMMAFDGGIPGRLSGTDPSTLDIGREGALLAAETGLGPDVARQAVESWATALCGYRPSAAGDSAAPIATGPRPSVRRLPSTPGATAGTAASPNAGASRRGWTRRWPAIALGLVVMIGGVAQIIRGIPQPVRPEQPAAPAAPAGGTPANPGTPPAPGGAPADPQAAATPEGFALLTPNPPFPTLPTERIKNSATTLGVWFGVKVDANPVSYYVAFAFDKGQRQGQGLIGATRGGQKFGSGALTADRIVETKSGKTFMRVAGPLQKNTAGLPGLCAFVESSASPDRIELVPDGLIVVFGLDSKGACDLQNRIGFGTLK